MAKSVKQKAMFWNPKNYPRIRMKHKHLSVFGPKTINASAKIGYEKTEINCSFNYQGIGRQDYIGLYIVTMGRPPWLGHQPLKVKKIIS
jgi:hypothetical protein